MAAASYSEVLLSKVREGMKRRGLNRAALAKKLGMDRRELRSVLAGGEPLSVDTFFAMVEALELSPVELGLPADLAEQAAELDADGSALDDESQAPGEPEGDAPAGLRLAGDARDEELLLVDPDGPQAAEVLRLGFALGADMLFSCEVSRLKHAGVPEAVLSRFPDLLPIKLDAAYHHANRAEYLPEGLKLRLSFDRVCTCLFPWGSIRQITIFPEAPLEPAEDPEEPCASPAGGPALRLVKS
jgi:transcriptional regulator with XRE-family HTH domain